MRDNHGVRLTIEVHKGESGYWLAGSPELDVYSQGRTAEEAHANGIEAVTLFLETTAEKGTLVEILNNSNVLVLDNPAQEATNPAPARPQHSGFLAFIFHRQSAELHPVEIRTFRLPEQAFAHS